MRWVGWEEKNAEKQAKSEVWLQNYVKTRLTVRMPIMHFLKLNTSFSIIQITSNKNVKKKIICCSPAFALHFAEPKAMPKWDAIDRPSVNSWQGHWHLQQTLTLCVACVCVYLVSPGNLRTLNSGHFPWGKPAGTITLPSEKKKKKPLVEFLREVARTVFHCCGFFKVCTPVAHSQDPAFSPHQAKD